MAIFSKRPAPGLPLSLQGVADGLNKMAKAWETLDVFNGRVEWANGSPLIIVDGQPIIDGEDEISAGSPLDVAGTPGLFKAVTLTGWTHDGSGGWTQMTIADMTDNPPTALWSGTGDAGNYLRPTWDYIRALPDE